MSSFLQTCNFFFLLLSFTRVNGAYPTSHCTGQGYLPVIRDIMPFTQDELNAARKAGLELHNYYRNLHGVPPLVLSEELNVLAQHGAECATKWGYFGATTLAEIRWGISRKSATPYNATEMTLSAINAHYSGYCQSRPDANVAGVGHTFAKILWRSHTKLGIGVARDAINGTGNWQGLRVYSQYSPAASEAAYSAGGVNSGQMRNLGPVVDNLICCRNKDPKGGGQLLTNVPEKDRAEKCFPLPPDSGGGDNNGGTGWGPNWWKNPWGHPFHGLWPIFGDSMQSMIEMVGHFMGKNK